MLLKKLLSICLLLSTMMPLAAQSKEDGRGRIFANQSLLSPVFEKLYSLEKNKKGKINIVHIGDSHIQADIFTNTIRMALQGKFGNGGFGFTFPYSLVRTNGTYYVKYVSNAPWESLKNVSPIADVGVGLSGIALYTSSQDFMLQLSTREEYKFNHIKIIYPNEQAHYRMSVTADALEVSGGSASGISSGTAVKYHTVKSGESLSVIGRKYGVTVNQIKAANGMKSNLIKPKQRLKIPGKGKAKAVKAVTRKTNIKEEELDFVDLATIPYCSSYTGDSLLDRITILPDKKDAMYNLNGFVIENDKPGIVYHTIGVNGAKMSDYNKYPLFFKQLPLLQPDLIILSFGTNESYGKLSDTEYTYQLAEFVNNIKKLNSKATILVMTPPPSLFPRRRTNPYVASYSVALMGLTNLPVWDLFSRMGGESGIRPRGEYSKMITRDNVHYTTQGYEAQGQLFSSDFIDAYNYFKNTKN
jgi:LysM repeat protein